MKNTLIDMHILLDIFMHENITIKFKILNEFRKNVINEKEIERLNVSLNINSKVCNKHINNFVKYFKNVYCKDLTILN